MAGKEDVETSEKMKHMPYGVGKQMELTKAPTTLHSRQALVQEQAAHHDTAQAWPF